MRKTIDKGWIFKNKKWERLNNENKMEYEWHKRKMTRLGSSFCSLARIFSISYTYIVLKLKLSPLHSLLHIFIPSTVAPVCSHLHPQICIYTFLLLNFLIVCTSIKLNQEIYFYHIKASMACCKELLKRMEPAKQSLKNPTWQQWTQAAYEQHIDLCATYM
jgi:hypothetical protein